MTDRKLFRQKLAETVDASLRVRARQLASGWGSGIHRANRKGSGVEFAGHRGYTPGDDLRHLDHHALLRHGRLLIREFHTDTERAIHLVVDASASMHYSNDKEQGDTKGQRATLLAGALAYLAKDTGDALGLSILTETDLQTLPPRASVESFERVLHELSVVYEKTQPAKQQGEAAPPWKSLIAHLGAQLPAGTLIFVLSDFLDLTGELSKDLARLCSRRRELRGLEVLTAQEREFPFDGALRLQDPETAIEVETDAAGVRSAYLSALGAHQEQLQRSLAQTGGQLFHHRLEDDPTEALRFLAAGSGL